MSELIVEICPETGICSLVRESGQKMDLMPDEVDDVRATKGDLDEIRAIVTESDIDFAAGLTPEELTTIARQVK